MSDESDTKCAGCGFDEFKNYTFDCSRCGNEICANCCNDGRHCVGCEMDIYSGDAEDEGLDP